MVILNFCAQRVQRRPSAIYLWRPLHSGQRSVAHRLVSARLHTCLVHAFLKGLKQLEVAQGDSTLTTLVINMNLWREGFPCLRNFDAGLLRARLVAKCGFLWESFWV